MFGRKRALSGTALCIIGLVLSLSAASAQIFETTEFAPIQPGGTEIRLETVATGITSPLKGVAAPGLPDYLFVVDQSGKLWAVHLLAGQTACPDPLHCQLFLDVGPTGLNRLVTLGILGPGTFDERGLLGAAFHPEFASNGRLYTYTSEPTAGPPTFPSTLPSGSPPDHQNVVAEWRAVNPMDPTMGVDPGSRRELMRVDWPQFNHNAGDLAFGPDGMLYISMGDGGGADDHDGQLFIVATGSFPEVDVPIVGHGTGNAQNRTNPLGKILRIDVDGANSANGQYGIPADNPFIGVGGGVLGEIYAFGLRNPYRFSFDRGTGALYLGDVGQNDLEEVDIIVRGGNYGWNLKEGTKVFNFNGTDPGYACDPATGPFPCPALPAGLNLIDPIAQYDTHAQGHSVIGGFVYRGSRIPQLQGRYVFADFSLTFDEVFPTGPFISGRLFYLAEKMTSGSKLLNIQQLGVVGTDGRVVARSELSLSILGMGKDVSEELYLLANTVGVPFGTDGVVLRLAPVRAR